jgi:hypothetical protein
MQRNDYNDFPFDPDYFFKTETVSQFEPPNFLPDVSSASPPQAPIILATVHTPPAALSDRPVRAPDKKPIYTPAQYRSLSEASADAILFKDLAAQISADNTKKAEEISFWKELVNSLPAKPVLKEEKLQSLQTQNKRKAVRANYITVTDIVQGFFNRQADKYPQVKANMASAIEEKEPAYKKRRCKK